MDRHDLDQQLELLRDDEPDVADARRHIAEDPVAALRSDRVGRFDARIGVAIRDVDVPAGLADRILVRLERESAPERAVRRRRFIYAGLGSAIAMTLLLGFAFWNRADPTWNSTLVAQEAAKVFDRRHQLPPSNQETPRLPAVGLGGTVLGFGQAPFLKKSGDVYRLQAAGGQEAVAIIVSASWFPGGFDFSATYSVIGADTVEVRFRELPDADMYCIVVARDLRPFEERPLIF
jgi:hypothetical protein